MFVKDGTLVRFIHYEGELADVGRHMGQQRGVHMLEAKLEPYLRHTAGHQLAGKVPRALREEPAHLHLTAVHRRAVAAGRPAATNSEGDLQMTAPTHVVRPLVAVGQEDTDRVGRKAAVLGELLRARFPYPTVS